MTLGSRIAQFRKQKGWTQSQFAKAVGMSPSTVAMYETNRRTPDDATLQKLAAALEVSIDALCGNSDVSTEVRMGQTAVDVSAVADCNSAADVNVNEATGALGRNDAATKHTAPDVNVNAFQQVAAAAEVPQEARPSATDEGAPNRGATVSPSNRTTFSLTREEARFILFMRMNPDCWPFLESYMYSDRAKRVQLEKTWRLLQAFQP
jgi:transcriptional regulator with XRE-family HTH domain